MPDTFGAQLHDRITRGEKLSDQEQALLEAWYAAQDRTEASELGIRDVPSGEHGQNIDHCRPRSVGGSDAPDNLLYCCVRCHQYKLDYWPTQASEPALWNPRLTPASAHFLEMEDGTLHPLTSTSAFTLRRLRLNRPPLIAHRLRRRQEHEEAHLLKRYRDLLALQDQLLGQQAALIREQQQLLEEIRRFLRLLLNA
jgi:hypothetical protein